MAVHVEKRARVIFRRALLKHYIDELSCGNEVDVWLKTHGGWFPDSQMTYGDGTPLSQPMDEGEDVMSKKPDTAVQDARVVMERLWISFSKDGDGLELSNAACIWLMDLGMISADLNRMEFAKETLQSFKRGRSRSPHRTNCDLGLIRIINEHAVEIVELREKIGEGPSHCQPGGQ